MARLARVVVPGVPHHIIQRGNRRKATFFRPQDYKEYLELMSQYCNQAGVQIWAYCLMKNHVHLIAVPKKEDSFRLGITEAHRRYTRHINFRKKARVVRQPGRYQWSSAKAHLTGENNVLVKVDPMPGRVEDWKAYLAEGIEREVMKQIELHSRTGRPLGGHRFIQKLEKKTGRILHPKAPGRPKRQK